MEEKEEKVKTLQEWKKGHPEEAVKIEKVLQICDKYHTSSLEPILQPQMKITTTDAITVRL